MTSTEGTSPTEAEAEAAKVDRREYYAARDKSEARKAWRKLWFQTEAGKAYLKRKEERRYARRKESGYYAAQARREETKAQKKSWLETEAGKASVKRKAARYRKTEGYRLAQERYRCTELYRITNARYRKSERYKEWRRQYNAKRRKLAPKAKCALPTVSALQNGLWQNGIYVAVEQLVPKYLPADIRDDMAMEIIVAILEGAHTIETARKALWTFAPPHYRDRFRQVSIDATISGTEGLRLIDVLAAPGPEGAPCW